MKRRQTEGGERRSLAADGSSKWRHCRLGTKTTPAPMSDFNSLGSSGGNLRWRKTDDSSSSRFLMAVSVVDGLSGGGAAPEGEKGGWLSVVGGIRMEVTAGLYVRVRVPWDYIPVSMKLIAIMTLMAPPFRIIFEISPLFTL